MFNEILLKKLSTKAKQEIEIAIKKVISEYGETLRLLGEENKESNDFKIGYIRAFFDGEGCISKQNKIIFTNTERCLLDKLNKYLTELGFNTYFRQRNNKPKDNHSACYNLFICSKNDVKRFFEMIGSNSDNKLNKYKNINR